MCDCKEVIIARAEANEEREMASTSSIERWGYSMVRMRGYRKSDGAPSKTFLYASATWKYCPFCGVEK